MYCFGHLFIYACMICEYLFTYNYYT